MSEECFCLGCKIKKLEEVNLQLMQENFEMHNRVTTLEIIYENILQQIESLRRNK